MKQFLCFFVAGVLISCHLVSAAVELCPLEAQQEFITGTLSQQCAGALNQLRFRPPPLFNISVPTQHPMYLIPVSSTDLDVACVASCGGLFTNWLSEECQDPYTARSYEAMCARTFGTADVGPRCRFGFPDAVDTHAIGFPLTSVCDRSATYPCDSDANGDSRTGEDDESTSHTDSESTTLNICGVLGDIIDTYGCCYNTLFNDTEFLGYITAVEHIDNRIMERGMKFGLSPIWGRCRFDVPPKCEELSSAAVHSVCSVLFVLACVLMYLII